MKEEERAGRGIGRRGPNLAKITAPAPPDIVKRPRLSRLFEQALSKPVVWICGPAGAGKTTLAASGLARWRRGSVLWYQVDAGDGDPASLFHYLKRGLRKVVPRSRKRLPMFMPHLQVSLDTFSRRFFRELFARLGPKFVLVFDNVQDAPAGSPFLEIVAAAANEIPIDGHLILISREKAVAEFSHHRARRGMAEIGWDDLRFRRDEAAALLALLGSEPSAAKLNEIMQVSQGWVAGIILMVANPGQPVAAGIDQEELEAVFDYFAAEVLERMGGTVRNFLVKTAFLSTVTPFAAAEVSGNVEAGAILENLSRRGFFVVRRSGGRIYEYHLLFRRFLLDRVGRELSSAERDDLRRRSAVALAAGGQVEAAGALIRQSEDWEVLAGFVNSQARPLIRHGRYEALAAWVEDIPADVVTAHPWLRYWQGVSRTFADPEGAERALTDAYQTFFDVGDAVGAYVSWARIVDFLTEFVRYGEKLDDWIDTFEALTNSFPAYPSKEIECRVAVSMLAALGYRRPWHPEVHRWGESAVRLADEVGDTALQFEACFHRLHSVVFESFRPERTVLLEKLRKPLRDPNLPVIDRLRHDFVLTAHHALMREHEACVRAGTATLAAAREHGLNWFVSTVLYNMGRSYLNVGDLTKAGEIADEIMALAPAAGNAALCYAHSLAGAHSYLLGKFSEAEAEIEVALAYLGESSETWGHVVARFIMAHVLAEQGKFEAARAQLACLRRFADLGGNDVVLHHCLLGEAEVALAEGDVETALARLRRGLALGQQANLQYYPTWRPAALARLMQLALEHDAQVETVQAIIRARELTPPDAARALDAWPRPLHIHTLGDFGLYRDGERLRFSRKAPQKPLELLKALIAFGSRGVGIERLKDALWPEAEGDNAQQSFEITLHRLRKVLGVDGALIAGENRLTLSSDLCWVDLWALEQAIGELGDIVAAPSPPGSDNRLEGLTRRVLDLYRGRFLHGLSQAPWATSAERQMAYRTARSCQELARLWQRRGRHDLAFACEDKARDIQRSTDGRDRPEHP
jgi:ATP/maltotriose-dependent transcriptional regulator MalT